MTLLDKAAPQVASVNHMFTIVGEPGSGKTSLGATFPNAFIIQTKGEDTPSDIETRPASLGGKIGSRMVEGTRMWDENELWEQLIALHQEEHEFKTLIIDSPTRLEALFSQLVIDQEQNPKCKNMQAAHGGYGKAWLLVQSKMMRLLTACERLRDNKGMHIVFICHADVERLDPPDGDPYTKYTIRLHKDKATDFPAIFTDNADVVAFVKQEVLLLGDENSSKKAKTTGDVIVSVTKTPANISKNRLGIDQDLVFKKGVNPFQEWM